jgi:hypothetical protein
LCNIALNERVIMNYALKYMEESDHELFQGAIPEISWRCSGKLGNIS